MSWAWDAWDNALKGPFGPSPHPTMIREQFTRQFLNEPIASADNVIFSAFPTAIPLTIVAVIRPNGNAACKTAAGKPEESHGQTELGSSSSTSDNVCGL